MASPEIAAVESFPMIPTTVDAPPSNPSDVYYPDHSDPIVEGQINADQRDDLKFVLRDYFRDAAVYIHGDLFVYYEEGNPRVFVGPDLFAVRGIGKHRRRVYQTWVEGKFPEFVLEITSDATFRQDIGEKVRLYEALGAQEYFLYDPQQGQHLRPPLQGYRLVAGRFQPIPVDAAGRLHSDVLGLDLAVQDGWLRLWDAAAAVWLPTLVEALEARRTAEARAEQAQARAEQAQARAEQADVERAAETERRRVAEARAAQAETELARLRAELARLRGGSA
jgi:Uma2 family endonuclease